MEHRTDRLSRNKIFQKKRRLKIRPHAKLLSNETRNAIAVPVIKGLCPIVVQLKKKQTSVYLWSLKQPSALFFELLEKMMFMMNSMANFFLATLLFMRLLRMFFKLQSDFRDAGRRQIYYLKKRSPFYLAMRRIFYWIRQFPEYQTFLNFFLNN